MFPSSSLGGVYVQSPLVLLYVVVPLPSAVAVTTSPDVVRVNSSALVITALLIMNVSTTFSVVESSSVTRPVILPPVEFLMISLEASPLADKSVRSENLTVGLSLLKSTANSSHWAPVSGLRFHAIVPLFALV